MIARFRILRIMMCAALFLACGRGRSMEPTPFPHHLPLTTMEGQKIKANLASHTNWLLVYVSLRGQRSEFTLRLLEKDQTPDVVAHTVIVIGGNPMDGAKLQSKHPGLASASWYADPDGQAAVSLQLHSLPSVIGVDHNTMRWKLGGARIDRGTFQSIVSGWVQPGARNRDTDGSPGNSNP